MHSAGGGVPDLCLLTSAPLGSSGERVLVEVESEGQ